MGGWRLTPLRWLWFWIGPLVERAIASVLGEDVGKCVHVILPFSDGLDSYAGRWYAAHVHAYLLRLPAVHDVFLSFLKNLQLGAGSRLSPSATWCLL